MQESGGYENTVNYMESIDTLLAERDSSLLEAHEAFALQRTLVGEWAASPMARVQWADRYTTRPPTVGRLILSDLGSAEAPAGRLPQAYGTNYWQVEWPSGYSRALRVALTSSAPGPWTLLLFDPRQETLQTARQVDGLTELVFTPTSGQSPILAVVRGGTDAFDPEMIADGVNYRLDFGPLVPDPIVDHVTPFEQLQGETAELTVSGLHFQEGASVTFLPDRIEVLEVRFVSDGQLGVSISVPKDALLGAYELRVTNPDGGAHTFGRAVFVKPAPARPALDGDGCTSSPSGRPAGPVGPWLLVGMFGLAGLIRRRWT